MTNSRQVTNSSFIETITNFINNNGQDVTQSGLYTGQTGLAIFYYNLFRFTREDEYEKKADELIEKVYDNLGSAILPLDFENGLTGIGWAFEYLVQHGFAEADTNEILGEIDDKLFHHIVHSGELPLNFSNGLLGHATYLIWRLRDNTNLEVSQILKLLLVDVINKISFLIENEKLPINETSGFNLFWDLPALLLVFAECLRLNIYKQKIFRILDDLVP